MRPRRPIWEADRALLHAVLVLSFDPGELENLACSGGREVARRTPWPALDVYLAASDACWDEGDAFGTLIERQLERMHARGVEALEAPGGLVRLRADLQRAGDLTDLADVTARLWALATCTRHGAYELCDQVGSLVSITSLRLLALATDADGRVRQGA